MCWAHGVDREVKVEVEVLAIAMIQSSTQAERGQSYDVHSKPQRLSQWELA